MNSVARGGPPPGGPPQTPPAGDEPTLVTALQEQLGLKLDPRRATVDVLVIDSVEKPAKTNPVPGGNYVRDSVSNTEIVVRLANQP